jgi:GNAT superfamily N-acetyltransferase
MDYTLKLSRRKIAFDGDEYLLPFGLIHYFQQGRVPSGRLNRIDNKLVLGKGESEIVVHPRFKSTFRVNSIKKRFTIQEVVTDLEKKSCIRLLLDEHYLKPPNRGVFVSCIDEVGNLAGCYVLDELTYGNPKPRINIDPALAKKQGWSVENWSSLDRGNVRKKLNLLWMSRIAVSPKYQGLGLGQAMAKSALALAKTHHPIKPKLLEVIASYKSEGQGSFVEERNIFCSAGFAHEFMSKATHDEISEETECYEPSPGEKYYFWSKV